MRWSEAVVVIALLIFLGFIVWFAEEKQHTLEMKKLELGVIDD